MKKLCVYDIEVLLNCFLCCARVVGGETRTFEISERRNDLEEMLAFFQSDKYIFVGYNCSHYDTPIVNMLIYKFLKSKNVRYQDVTDEAYALSAIIINGDQFSWKNYKYANLFPQIDLMTMMASKALRVGLKSLQVTMCYKNVKEMGIDWRKPIDAKDIDDLIYYCQNDVGSTTELLTLLKGDLVLRQQIQKEFNIQCLSKDGVGIGVDIFTKFVCAKLGIYPGDLKNYVSVPSVVRVKDYIQPCIKFKTKTFNDLLDWYKSLVLTIDEAEEQLNEDEKRLTSHKKIETWEDLEEAKGKGKYKKKVLFNNLAHMFALGGVHSVNRPKIYVEDADYELYDEDVTSYYPSLALAYGFGPDGFKTSFLEVMAYLRDERVVAKRTGDKLKNEAYKLALNSILGNLKNKFSPYFAPHMNVAICVNGQLMLAMLIETCELAGIECISSNTDGATFRVHKSKREEFLKICNDWSEVTKMGLEEAQYEKMVIYAVNDYIAFKKGYSEKKNTFDFLDPYRSIREPKNENLTSSGYYVKEKGMFITVPRLGKGLDCLIIPKAIQNYFGKGIPVEETIYKADSIWDFLRFQKVGKQYQVLWNNQPQQHINRFYISRKGAYLYKEKEVDKINKKTGMSIKVKSLQNMLKGFGVNLFNEHEVKEMSSYDIDYSYYISTARKIIEQLNSSQTSLF